MYGPFDIVWTMPNGHSFGRYALSKEAAAAVVREVSKVAKSIDALMHSKRFATMTRDADGDMRFSPRNTLPAPRDLFDLDEFNRHLVSLFSRPTAEPFDLADVNRGINNLKFN